MILNQPTEEQKVKDYNASITILEGVKETIRDEHPIQQLLAETPARNALAHLQVDAQMDTGLPNVDHRLSLMAMNAFRLGAYLALQSVNSTPVSIDDAEKIKQCLNCPNVKSKNGSFYCPFEKCKYEK